MSAQPLEIRMAHLEGAYEQMSERLRGVDGRLTALDQKIDLRFDGLDQKIESLNRKVDTSQWRMVSLVVGTWITLMLAIFLHKP
ncbi:MAG: hypothetical protein ACRENA_03470 [Vulcanimicrobiaceae bacterium]